MVAPYSEGYLCRSLVRVPNNRVDRTAAVVISDLSRVSALAAAVTISRSVPSALQRRSSPCDHVNAKGQPVPAPTPRSFPRASEDRPVQTTASGPSPSTSGGQAAQATAPTPKRATTKTSNTLGQGGKRTRPVEAQVNTPSADGDHPPAKKAKVVQKVAGQAGASTSTSLPNLPTPQLLATSLTLPQTNSSQPLPVGAPPVMLAGYSHLLQPAVVMTSHELLQERDYLRHENLALKQKLSLFHMLFRNKEKLTSVVRTLGIQVR